MELIRTSLGCCVSILETRDGVTKWARHSALVFLFCTERQEVSNLKARVSTGRNRPSLRGWWRLARPVTGLGQFVSSATACIVSNRNKGLHATYLLTIPKTERHFDDHSGPLAPRLVQARSLVLGGIARALKIGMANMPKEPEAFAEHVATLLRQMQPDYVVELTGPRELIVNGRRLDLENLYRLVNHDPNRGQEIVEHYLDQLFSGEASALGTSNFDLVHQRIMPRIQPESVVVRVCG